MHTRRDLGLWETYCALGHDDGHGTGNTCMAIHLEGELNFSLLTKAFYKLFLRHPLLRSTLTRNEYYFFRVNADFDSIPIKHIENEVNWLDYFCEEIRKLYPIDKYLWRVNLLSSKNHHHLLFSAHHAIIDGMSQISLVKNLLTYYQELYQKKDDEVISLNLPPSIEKHLPTNITWQEYTNRLKTIDESYLPIQPLHFWGNTIIKEVVPRVLVCDFPREVLAKLISFCKRNTLRVNPVINAALLLAASQAAQPLEDCTLHNAVNLRQYAGQVLSEEDVGCFISVVKTLHNKIGNTELKQLAQQCQQEFYENFRSTAFPPKIFPMDVIQQYFVTAEKSGRDYFSSGFGISNWGAIVLANHSPLKITGLHRCSGRQLGDFPFFLHIATINGEIFGAFSFVEPLMSANWMTDFIKNFRRIVTQLK